MSLPTTFAALTQATGAELDNNFAALGALTPIPCTVTGTTALVLTPVANTPTQTAYSNYKQFTFINSNTNSGAVTARVGAFSALNVYKDTPAGPVVLTGGELIANCASTILYDSTLNTGSGGWHLINAIGTVTFAGGTFTGPIVGTTISATALMVGSSVSSIVRALSTTSGITLSALNPGTGTTAAIYLPGCSVGDIVQLGLPVNTTVGLVWKGYVSASNTITLQAFNATPSSTITPAPGTYRVASMGYSP